MVQTVLKDAASGAGEAAPADWSDLIARYDQRVPRYTSYPTANHFGAQVDAGVYADWLGRIGTEKPIEVYVHVPFCSRLCWFCGCHTRAVNRRQPVSDYVSLLRQEAALMELFLPSGVWANGLHLGGGTPNLLSRDDLVELFGVLNHVFHLAPGAEIGAELDPESLTRDWVRAAAHFGLSRASLGVQDLSPAVQAAVNRSESFESIQRAVGWLREAGVRSVNLDLMYGLPLQTKADVIATLDSVLRLEPERIAMFGYAHVPWMKPHQKLIDQTALPAAAERLEQSLAAGERLVRAGYVRVGMDHYALPGDDLAKASLRGSLARTFQGYVARPSETLIGLGASAISHLAGGFVQNLTPELEWRQRIEQGVLPVARGYALSDEDRFRGEIIERLMCDLAVDLEVVCRRHGRLVTSLWSALARLEPMLRDGLIEITGDRIAMTARGAPFVRAACAVFDAYLEPSAGRHAPAL
jgi:oxygen-independent coproporphyrinogen-3 oxidase